MKKLDGVRRFPLHAQQNLESRGARWSSRHDQLSQLFAQLFARCGAIAAHEVSCSHGLLALRLKLKQTQQRPAGAANQKLVTVMQVHLSGSYFQVRARRLRGNNFYSLTAILREGSRPRLKSAQAVMN